MKQNQSDDLITRLEQMAARMAINGATEDYWEDYLIYRETATLLQEAANEIKALQAERRLLRADYDNLWEAYEAKGYELKERS